MLADAAADLEHECSKLYSVPRELAAEEIAALTKCTDSEVCSEAEHEEAMLAAKEEHEEEGSSESSDSDDNVPITPVVDRFMDIPTAPVVGGDLGEAKRLQLAELYMAAKERPPPSEARRGRQRNTFLSLQRNTWIITRAPKTGKSSSQRQKGMKRSGTGRALIKCQREKYSSLKWEPCSTKSCFGFGFV